MTFADGTRAAASFKSLPSQEQARWSARAKLFNQQQKAVRSATLESRVNAFRDADKVTGKGYLGLGDAVEPMSVPSLLAGGYGQIGSAFTKRRAASWELRAGRRRFDSREAKATRVLPDHCRKGYNVCRRAMSTQDVDLLRFIESSCAGKLTR